MNIVYTVNDNFVPQVASGICSIYENNKQIEVLDIYIISVGITDTNKEKLSNFAAGYNRQIFIIELDNLKNYFDFEIDTKGWNPIVLSRLVLDKLLPKKVKKIVYLDGDTIVRGSLKELWDTDMGESIIGACPEVTVDKKRKLALGMESVTYCNAGVLLINLQKWHDTNLSRRILEYYKKNIDIIFANDQDAINGALKDELYILSPKYNFFNIYHFYPYKTLKRLSEPVGFISEQEYNEVISNPIIIHYLGEERPWRKGNKHKFRHDYEHYLSMTPWKDTPMEDGWQFYFICFGIFNFILRPFPTLRYKIINGLIPAFIKIRSKKIKK